MRSNRKCVGTTTPSPPKGLRLGSVACGAGIRCDLFARKTNGLEELRPVLERQNTVAMPRTLFVLEMRWCFWKLKSFCTRSCGPSMFHAIDRIFYQHPQSLSLQQVGCGKWKVKREKTMGVREPPSLKPFGSTGDFVEHAAVVYQYYAVCALCLYEDMYG